MFAGPTGLAKQLHPRARVTITFWKFPNCLFEMLWRIFTGRSRRGHRKPVLGRRADTLSLQLKTNGLLKWANAAGPRSSHRLWGTAVPTRFVRSAIASPPRSRHLLPTPWPRGLRLVLPGKPRCSRGREAAPPWSRRLKEAGRRRAEVGDALRVRCTRHRRGAAAPGEWGSAKLAEDPDPLPAAQCEDERRGGRRPGGRHQQRAARHPLQQAAGPALPQPRRLWHRVRRPPRRLEGPGSPQVPAGPPARQVAERARGVLRPRGWRVFPWGTSVGVGECWAAPVLPLCRLLGRAVWELPAQLLSASLLLGVRDSKKRWEKLLPDKVWLVVSSLSHSAKRS